MSLKNMSKEELEILSYTDLAEMLLTEEQTSLNTPNLFHKICDLLGYSEEEYTEKIGDFYTSLTIDKRFVFLDTEWDLREKHAIEIILDDDDDDDIEEVEDTEEEIPEELEDDIDAAIEDDDLDDDVDDDMEDLAVLSDEELEEEN